METERLILDSTRESDKEDYFINISHDMRSWDREEKQTMKFKGTLIVVKDCKKAL